MSPRLSASGSLPPRGRGRERRSKQGKDAGLPWSIQHKMLWWSVELSWVWGCDPRVANLWHARDMSLSHDTGPRLQLSRLQLEGSDRAATAKFYQSSRQNRIQEYPGCSQYSQYQVNVESPFIYCQYLPITLTLRCY